MLPPCYEVPVYTELLEFADSLPPDEADALLAGARQAPLAPEPEASEPTPALPAYMSWEDFLAGRMTWRRKKATRANGPRLMLGAPDRSCANAPLFI